MVVLLFTILVVVSVISLMSLVGLFTLSMKDKSLNEALFFIVSFATGSLLGAAFLDLLPESLSKGHAEWVFALVLVGILISYVIEEFLFHYHCHGHACKHEHHHIIKPFGYLNLVGDSVHNFIDGMVVAGSFIAGPTIGISSSIAIIAHEIPQEIGDFSILLHAGFTRKKALFFNFLTALTAIVGALVGYYFSVMIEPFSTYLAAFAVGNFIYIALSDLVPVLHHETSMKRAVWQFVMMILGILVIVAVKTLLPE